LLRKARAGYIWDHLDGKWLKLNPKQMRPGIVILLPASAGGYDWNDEFKTGKGWEADSKTIVTPLPPQQKVKGEAVGSDQLSEQNRPLTITVHTTNVCSELGELLPEITKLLEGWSSDLDRAARWHDVGKAHVAFQTGMRNANPVLDLHQLWAKSGTNARLRHGRKHFPPRVSFGTRGPTTWVGVPGRIPDCRPPRSGNACNPCPPGEDEPNDRRRYRPWGSPWRFAPHAILATDRLGTNRYRPQRISWGRRQLDSNRRSDCWRRCDHSS